MNKTLMIAIALTGFSVSACAQTGEPPMTPATYNEYHDFAAKVNYQDHTVDVPAFNKMIADPKTVVVDLRSREEYDHQHIKGAVHLGADVSEETMAKIVPSKDTPVIFYCRNSLQPSRMVSLTSVALPQALYLGYKNVHVLGNGMGMNVDSGKLVMEPK